MDSIDKFLITGFSGFVSKHFLDLLESRKQPVKVLGVDIQAPEHNTSHYENVSCEFVKADLLNKNDVEALISRFRPRYVLHLASYSSVAYSWKMPVESFTNNTNIFLNLIETIRRLEIPCRVLSIGSSEEYGNVSENDLPLKETAALKPLSPYAVARVSQEMLSKVYVDSYGMDIIMTRSFNHIGTHQKDLFVIPSFAIQLQKLKQNGGSDNELITGDTSVIRDFVDVRDVVEAYYELFKKGREGEIYNICSGKGVSLDDVIRTMAGILGIQVTSKTDPSRVRPNDNKVIIGSNEKIKAHTGWSPRIPIESSLRDILAFYGLKN